MPYTTNSDCRGCTACLKVCPVNAISGKAKNQHIIDAATCIECGACGRTCQFNAVIDEIGTVCTFKDKALREKPKFDLNECCGCRQCEIACPVSCIDLKIQLKKDGTLYPYLKNKKDCISCGFCYEACPISAIKMGELIKL